MALMFQLGDSSIDSRDDKIKDVIIENRTFAYKSSWKDIMFLPYNRMIEVSFLCTLFVGTHVYLYICGFQPDLYENTVLNNINWLFEITYVIHTGLTVFHRFYKHYRKRRWYPPQPLFVIIIDIISCVPISSTYYFIQNFSWTSMPPSTKLIKVMMGFKLIRFVRLLNHYMTYTSDPGINKKYLVPIFHFIFMSLLAHVITLIYKSVLCYKCNFKTWSDNIQFAHYNTDKEFEWFIIIYTYVYSILLHTNCSFLINARVSEILIAIFALVAGLLIKFLCLIGVLIAVYIRALRNEYFYKRKMRWLDEHMTIMKFSKSLHTDILTYYELIWTEYKGSIHVPPIMDSFPKSLKREICTDIYWEAIMHTHIFSVIDWASKKDVCTVMKTEIYVPGEMLFRSKEIKSKMVYIVSGVVQLLATENNSSPIISFTSGSILGEFSSILPTKSKGNFRCSTLCHLHVLYFSDLIAVVKSQPRLKQLKKVVHERLFFAKLKRSVLSYAGVDLRKSHIPWIKMQWKNLIEIKKNIEDEVEPTQDEGYTSKFLNLLALEVTETWKPGIICIRGDCPCVMQKHSSFRHFLHFICLITVLLQVITTAPMIAFSGKIHTAWYPFLCVLDFLYMLDLYIQIITGTTVDKLKIIKPTEVLLHRSKQVMFLVDIIASIPFDYFAAFFGARDSIIALLRVPRFLKLYKVFAYLGVLERKLMQILYQARLVKFFIMNQLLLMILVAANYLTNCFDGYCDPTGWLLSNRRMLEQSKGYISNIGHYLETYMRTTSIYFSLKISGHNDTNVKDSLMSLLILIIGFYSTAFCFVQVVAIMALKTENKHNFFMYLDVLDIITDSHEHMKHLKSEINDFAKLQYTLNENKGFDEIFTVMGCYSKFLKQKVCSEYIEYALRHTSIFKKTDITVLKIIAHNTKVIVIPAGHTVVKPQYKNCYLFVIMEGYCRFKSMLPGDVENNRNISYTKYTCFPVISLFYEIVPMCLVETETTVILLCIPYLTLRSLFKAFPQEGNIIKKTCEKHFQMHRPLMDPKRDIILSKPSMGLGLKVDVFNYRRVQISVQNATVLHVTQFQKMFLRLIKTTYDPCGKFFFCYESCKSVLIFTKCITSFVLPYPAVYDFLEDYGYFLYYLDLLINLVDFFIRAHVQYYNSNGVKVTHAYYTLWHYILTSFTIDFISGFPYRLMGINGLFLKSNSKKALFLLNLSTTPLQFYRPINLLSYIQSSIYVKHQKLIKLSALVCGSYLMYCIYTIYYLLFTLHIDDKSYKPFADSWLTLEEGLQEYVDNNLTLIFFYAVSTVTVIYTFRMYSHGDHIRQTLIGAIVYLTRFVFLTYSIGILCHGNTKLATHQDHIKNYLQFSRRKKLGKKEIEEMMAHINNSWKKTKDYRPGKVFKDFHPLIKEEVLMGLYRHALLCCGLCYDSDMSFFRILSCHFQEIYFKKGAHIIRKNDVQGMLYFIATGIVDIHVETIRLVCLRVGGLFGCFNPTGLVRQTITASAKVHVKVLCIETKTFYNIITMYPVIHARMMNQHNLFCEFLKEIVPIEFNSSQMTFKIIGDDQMRTIRRGIIYKTISETNVYYKIWDYISNVHIASISAIYCCYAVALKKIQFISIWFVLDLYFLSNFYMRSHISFTDLESGVIVHSIKASFLRYMKSFLFYIDLISTLPVYFIPFFYQCDHESYFLSNKLLRIVNLYGYYRVHQIKKNVPRHIQWVFLCYTALFILQIVFNIWYITVVKYDRSLQIAASYLHVISVFTSTGLREDESVMHHKLHFLVNLIIATILQYLYAYVFIVVSQMLVSHYQIISRYRTDTDEFLTYSRNERLSHILVGRVWTYLMYLYKFNGGRQLPYMMTHKAPQYILQDHMKCIYGRLVERTPIFMEAHVDFLRQLYQYLEAEVYLPGDVIAEIGDCNGIMYFIEEGEIIAIEPESSATKFEILNEGTFGELQGILEYPYDKTYKAFTTCSIVSLSKEKWFYLLDWFPATSQSLHIELNKMLLKNVSIQTSQISDDDDEADTHDLRPRASSQQPMDYSV